MTRNINSNFTSTHATADGANSPDMVWKVLAAVAKHAVSQHDYSSAERYLQQSLSAASETFGADDIRLAVILLECADLHCLRGDLKQARLLNHRAKRIIEQHLMEESDYKMLGH
jgi:ATP/maltotriose-dependent transcriptional regulator MalT